MHVRVVPDTDGFRQRLKQYLEMLEKYSKLKIKVELNDGGVGARLNQLTRDRRVNIRAEADTAAAAARIAALARDRRARIDVDADVRDAERQVRGFTGRRWRLLINIHMARGGIDRIKSGIADMGRGLATIGRGVGQLFTQAGQAVSTLADGITGMARGAAGMAAGFAQTAAAALPLLATVMAIAAWVTVVASGLIAVIALAALPILPIGLAAIAAAGNMKELGDKAEDAMIRVSEALKPATASMREEFGGALKDITAWFKQAEPMIKGFFDSGAQFVRPMVDSILQFTDVLFPKLTAAMNSAGMKQFTDALPAALVGIGDALGDFFVTLADGGGRLKEILPPLVSILDQLLQGIAKLAVQFSPQIAEAVQNFADAIGHFFRIFADNADATVFLMKAVDVALNLLLASFEVAMTGLDFIVGAAKAAWQGIQAAWDGIVAGTSAAWSAVVSVVSEAWESIKSGVSSAVSAVVSWVSEAWNSVKSWTSDAWNSVKSWTSDAWNSVTSFVSDAVENVKSAVSGAWDSVKTWTSEAWETVKRAVSDAWNSIKEAVSQGISSVVGFVSELPGKIIGALGDLAGSMFDAGKKAIQGLVDGLGSIDVMGVVGGILGKVKDAASGIGSILGFSVPVEADTQKLPAPVPVASPLPNVADQVGRLDAYSYGRSAARALQPGTEAALSRLGRGPSITVNARTNADPYEIGKQIAWELKTSGR
ncbi:phage tail protein [Kitasatospora sp. McL0602]|uniref:phage tail protein n=1 Tax=Kitasatospora sp. McL0602 TaxID=3439530 RepID=UPI003F8BC237